MSQVLLIPGFATELRLAFRHPGRGADAGFGAARALVGAGRATVFRWGLAADATGLAALNPATYLRLYAAERQLAVAAPTLLALHAQCRAQPPAVVVCHSMGCRVWLAYVAAHGLPPGLRQVVFVQADVPAGFHPAAARPAGSGAWACAWLNLWCGWDQALWTSEALNGCWPAGLVGARHPGVQNQFFPLYRTWNLHRSSIMDPGLLRHLPI